MKTPHNPSACSTTALVHELDDAALRSGHALLDNVRVHDYAHWLERQLATLEQQFQAFGTPCAVRRSLGR